jgi:hypothetical protein
LKKQPYSFFTIVRDLTLWVISEIGSTQAREYLPIPADTTEMLSINLGKKLPHNYYFDK